MRAERHVVPGCESPRVLDRRDRDPGDRGHRLARRAGRRRCPRARRSAPQISPTVQRARSASRIGDEQVPVAARRRAAPRRAPPRPPAASRSARTRAVRSSWRRSASGSRRCSSTCSSSASAKRLTPTIDALARLDVARASGRPPPRSRSWTKPASIAATAPPSSSTRSISSRARGLELVGQRLDEVGAAERVGRVGRAGLVREDLLRPQRDPRRALGRQRERLVERVRVQRLRAAADRRRAPGSRRGRRCSRAAARSASSRPSARGSAARAPSGSSRRTARA